MRGDQISLPIHGAVRRHEWQPIIRESGNQPSGRKILDALSKRGGQTSAELANATGLLRGTVHTYLCFLTHSRQVVREGANHAYRYWLPK